MNAQGKTTDTAMTQRELVRRLLHYEDVDRLPVVHFGFWRETLQKWAGEGHLTTEEAAEFGDGNPVDAVLSARLGFDFNWYSAYHPESFLYPGFESRTVREFPDGSRHVLQGDGVTVLQRPDATSIPTEIEHLLKDRASWERHYRRRFAWSEERVQKMRVRVGDQLVTFEEGGLDYLRRDERPYHYGLSCGSLYGKIRNILGVENACYLAVDDEPLFDEIVETVADTCYRTTEYALKTGAKFDFGHFWEDICFKNGPLIAPSLFAEKIGLHYRRITDLLRKYGIDIVSVDCDGCIDALVPIWLENGVNTMFPIEVGTWGASIQPWREKYGRELRGVGGMNKVVFSRDRAAVAAEVERLRPLVELGGYIPCPDHRIPPDAKWDNVRYYCDRMREVFG